MSGPRDWLGDLHPTPVGVRIGGVFTLLGQPTAQPVARVTAERTPAQQRVLARDAARRARRERLLDCSLAHVEAELEPHRRALVAARQGDRAASSAAVAALEAAEAAAVSPATTMAANAALRPAVAALAARRRAPRRPRTRGADASAADGAAVEVEAAQDGMLVGDRARRLAAERYIVAAEEP